MKKWRAENPEEKNKRMREWRAKWAGVPEVGLQKKVQDEFQAYSLDKIHPDLYDTKTGIFIEVKRALPFRRCSWTAESTHFPGLYFFRVREFRHTASLDEQIERYPKPLIVVIFNGLTGEEITRKKFEREV